MEPGRTFFCLFELRTATSDKAAPPRVHLKVSSLRSLMGDNRWKRLDLHPKVGWVDQHAPFSFSLVFLTDAFQVFAEMRKLEHKLG